jgi:hypothetical protein
MHKKIKVTTKEKTEYFYKNIDVAKKFKLSPQRVGQILNGKIRKNYIIYEDEIYNFEYVNDIISKEEGDISKKEERDISKKEERDISKKEEGHISKKEEGDISKKEEGDISKKEEGDTCEKKEHDIPKNPLDLFSVFFNEAVEKTKDKHAYVTITSLFDKFKNSNYYLNSAKTTKQKFYTKKQMREYFESHKQTGASFTRNFDKKINDIRIHVSNVLVGYKFKEEYENDDL